MKNLTISALLLLVGGASQAETGGSSAGPVEVMEDLQRSYSSIESIHFKAAVLLTIHNQRKPTVGSGTFEYWAEGNRYRIRTSSDPRLGLTQDFDIAFDGSRFQLLDIGTSTLSFRSRDLRAIPVAMPNPLFLPLDFLSKDNDECLLCRLRFADIKGDAVWAHLMATASVLPSPLADSAQMEVPGGALAGEEFVHQLFFSEQGQEGSLQKIERVTASGRKMLSIEIGSYESFSGSGVSVVLPRHLSVKTYNYRGNGAVVLESDFVIDKFDLNRPFDEATFTISHDSADYVYDSETETHLKRP